VRVGGRLLRVRVLGYLEGGARVTDGPKADAVFIFWFGSTTGAIAVLALLVFLKAIGWMQ
jgi:hypothetical protein